MTAGVTIVDGIVIAIAVQVQAVDGFGGEVGSIIGADEAAPLGTVIPGITVIQAGIFIEVIATVTNRVGISNSGIGSLAGDRAVAPGIVQVGNESIFDAVDSNCITR